MTLIMIWIMNIYKRKRIKTGTAEYALNLITLWNVSRIEWNWPDNFGDNLQDVFISIFMLTL